MPEIGIAGTGAAARLFALRLASAGLQAVQIAPQSRASELSAGMRALRTLVLAPRDILETEALLFEGQCLASTLPLLDTIIIAATLHPRFVRALRGRIDAGIGLVDAPWTGTLRAAEEGQISFFLGGESAVIARHEHLFSALARGAVRMGEFGTGMSAKILSDHFAVASGALTRLALDWAEAQGLDEAHMLDIAGKLLMAPEMPGFGCDLGDGAGDDRISDLMRGIEASFDTALAGAHLTPPRRTRQITPGARPRPLH